VAGVDGGEPVGEAEQRVEQWIVLQAGQGIDRIEAMRDERRDHGVGRRHFGRRAPGFVGRFPLHFHWLRRSVQIGAVLSRRVTDLRALRSVTHRDPWLRICDLCRPGA